MVQALLRAGRRAPWAPAAAALALFGASVVFSRTEGAPSAIRFSLGAIPFRLEHGETAARHVPATMAGGVAVFDYNSDGRPDIFFTNGANLATLKKDSPKYANRLFRNDGNGVFTDVTKAAGLAGTGYDSSVAVGDYDNDGYPDLFVGRPPPHHPLPQQRERRPSPTSPQRRGLAPAGPGIRPPVGDRRGLGGCKQRRPARSFHRELPEMGLRHRAGLRVQGAADYCSPRYYKGLPNQLFLNNGDGTFRDVSKEWGIRAHVGKGMGAGMADYDLDGRPDLFVTNDAELQLPFPQSRQQI